MAFRPLWNLDLKQLDVLKKSISVRAEDGARLLNQFSTQLTQYETKVRKIAKGFDLKSQTARRRSEAKLEEFLGQLKKTRGQVEKGVSSMVKLERKKIHKKLSDLMATLRQLAGKEMKKAKAKPAKKAPRPKKRAPRKQAVAPVTQ